jgi:hypothetical protein
VGSGLVLALAACQTSLDPSEDQMAAAERQWTEAAIRDYSMVVTRSGLTGNPVAVRVTVAGGAATERRYVATDEPVAAGDGAKYPHVDELFALLRAAFDAADAVTVSFDPTYGYPASVIIDYVRSTFDDDVGFAVTEFTPAP